MYKNKNRHFVTLLLFHTAGGSVYTVKNEKQLLTSERMMDAPTGIQLKLSNDRSRDGRNFIAIYIKILW